MNFRTFPRSGKICINKLRCLPLLLLLACLLAGSVHAQLLHRYDFSVDARDSVGTANGMLEGSATISGGCLNTAAIAGGLSGGVPQNGVMLPAAAVSGITGAFTIQTWFIANYGGGYTTLFCFSGNNTANYVLATPAVGFSPYQSRVEAVGGGGSSTYQQANEQYQDNGVLHDLIVTYDGTTLSYYIDGALASFAGLSPTLTDPGLNLSTLPYIGISGASPYADNSPNGSVLDFRIFGQTLSTAQIAGLHALGADATNTAIANTLATAAAGPATADPAVALTNYTGLGEWNTAGNFENWTTTNVSGATVSGGTLSGTGSAALAQLSLLGLASGPDLDLGFNDTFDLRIQVPSSFTGDVHVCYGSTFASGINSARMLTVPNAQIPKDGAPHLYRLDMGLVPPWRGTLTDLRIELTNATNVAFAADYVRVGDPAGEVYTARITSECPAAGGTTPSGAASGPSQSVYSLESKHFRYLWNDAVAANAAWTSNMPHGTLRNAEEQWQILAKKLGYREPCYAVETQSGTKYKVNITSWYSGYWEGGDTYNGTTLARDNVEPSGLQVDPPTLVLPHELTHVFQMHNTTGYVPGSWWEGHANYGRERYLEYYGPYFYAANARSGIDPTYLRCAHQLLAEGRDYYLSWPLFLYLDENPDGLPDLGEGTMVKLWQQTAINEYPLTTLERLTPTSTVQDIVGYFARRGATYNYAHKADIQAALANFGSPLDNAATARWQFTDLVQRPDDPTWWRVPFEMAPMQGAYAIHELVPTGTGAGRVVTVNFHGLPDSARGADWRASFIVISDTGLERYSTLWNGGTNSVTLAANENKVYLSVAGTPATFYTGSPNNYFAGDYDESVYPYRSWPSKSRFPYELQVTGATPRQRDNGSTSGLVQHSNGGGYKASTATVAATAYLGPNARVLGSATVSGSAQILDYAVVQGSAQVSGNAIVSGHALVRGNAVVTGHAKVRDWALVEGGTISSYGRVLEHANIKGGTVTDLATAKGSAGSLTGTLSGNAIIDGDFGDFFSGRDVANSVAFGHLPYVGQPDNFLRPLPTSLYASYDFATAHDSRILDQYGVTDGFTIGSPAWVAADARRKGFLSFDGSSQAVALDRSVADFGPWTFTAWVKPLGGAANQAALWLGASVTQRLYFTPDDGTGHAKFSILKGGVEQTLTGAALTPGLWTHVAVTLDGTTGTLYLNGVAAASGAVTITPDQTLAPNTATGLPQNYLARSAGTLMPMFRGALDDVQFYGAALSASAVAALQPPSSPVSAGTLYVDLRASDASAGAATWVNNGTNGNFTKTGSPSLVANVGSTGVPGVLFNGTNQAYTGANSNADIDGGSDRSIEVWAYNPALTDEESLVSWGYRGTVRSDMSFNFGSASTYNAATHWGDDVPWATPPSAGAWHHLVYTYDGNVTARVYVDGALSTTQTLGGVLTTFASQPINLACQRETASGTRSKFFSGYLNSVRVHGGALTAAQVAANYAFGPYGAPADVAPTLAAIADQTVNYGGSVSIPLTVNDTDTAVTALTLSGAAANATLVPASSLVFSGSGSARSVTIRPTAGIVGVTTVTLTVSDGLATATRSFNLTVLNQAQTWRKNYFGASDNSGNAADNADPDGDGVSNLLERAFGGNPTLAEQNLLPAVDPTGPLLSIVYRQADAATDLVFTVQECSDLAGNVWTTSTGTTTALSDDGVVQRVRFTTPAGTTSKKFLRLQVAQPQS